MKGIKHVKYKRSSIKLLNTTNYLLMKLFNSIYSRQFKYDNITEYSDNSP